MSKKITIRCKQVVEYYQDVIVTDEQWAILREVDGCDVDEDEETKRHTG